MGRYINPDQPMSDEDKEFLKLRGREDEVIENEKRFPTDGDPAEHEEPGFMPKKPGYDYKTQAERTEDATGLPITQIPVDEEGNPRTPEYANEEPDEDYIDDDILEFVLGLNVEELKGELEKLDLKKSGNKDELIDRLANGLQDRRDSQEDSDEEE